MAAQIGWPGTSYPQRAVSVGLNAQKGIPRLRPYGGNHLVLKRVGAIRSKGSAPGLFPAS